MDDYLTIFQSGLWRLIYRLSKEGRARFFNEFLPLLHSTKLAILGPRDQNSYYLVYLGTKRDRRGQGLAKELVRHTTQNADSEGRACYLESSNVLNLGLYRRLGFVVKQKIVLHRGPSEIGLHIMIREPVDEHRESQHRAIVRTDDVPVAANGLGIDSVRMKIHTKGSTDERKGVANPQLKAYSAVKTGDNNFGSCMSS